MSDQSQPRKPMTLMEGIDETWGKFRAFLLDTLLDLKVPENKIEFVREITKHNSLAYLPKIRQFVLANKKMILAREKNFFRAYLRQKLAEKEPDWKDVEIPDKILERGLNFGKAFVELVQQLEQ